MIDTPSDPIFTYASTSISLPRVVKLINVLKNTNVYKLKLRLTAQDEEFISDMNKSLHKVQTQRN